MSHFMRDHQLTVSFVESASTGRFVYDFTSVPDCGPTVRGSIVCYDPKVKESLLGVSGEVIEQYTAESAEVTQHLANSLKTLIPADIIIAVTGLASPGGSETPEKPVGTMFVHGYIGDEPFRKRFVFDGGPDEIIKQTIDSTATFLLERLQSKYA
ncbi:CinA family protein [Telluribacter humicola]